MATATGLDAVPAEWDGMVRCNGTESNWQNELPREDIAAIMDNENCQAYMAAAGYGSDGKYDNLEPPEGRSGNDVR